MSEKIDIDQPVPSSNPLDLLNEQSSLEPTARPTLDHWCSSKFRNRHGRSAGLPGSERFAKLCITCKTHVCVDTQYLHPLTVISGAHDTGYMPLTSCSSI